MAGTERLLLDVAVILMAAKVGGELASRLRQPAIIGEMLAGVLLGPTMLGLIPSFDIVRSVDAFLVGTGPIPSSSQFASAQVLQMLAVLAELGVLILLFEVGLESNLGELRRVGWSAALVGTYGVAISLVLGVAASYLIATRIDWVLGPAVLGQPALLHVFVGATLTATSVGITARVLSDLGTLRSPESQIILGAAVFDDVLGLIVLAIVAGLAGGPSGVSAFGVARVVLLALGFFVLALVAGHILGPRLLDAVHKRFQSPYIDLGFSVVFLLIVAYLATWVGLAAIVGAFAAGISLSSSPHRHLVFEHVKPVGSLFVSVFFVMLGARVDLTGLDGRTSALVIALGVLLTLVAVAGKLGAGLGVVGVQASRLVVGVGMVPRGEVGLIFAVFGLDHGLVNDWQYSTLILVVLLSTLITPAWLARLRPRFTAPAPYAPTPPEARLGEAIQP